MATTDEETHKNSPRQLAKFIVQQQLLKYSSRGLQLIKCHSLLSKCLHAALIESKILKINP